MITYAYLSGKEALLNQDIDLLNDTIKAALLTSSYTPDLVNDAAWADVSANEIGATGSYASGGATLASPVVDQDSGDEEAYFDADDVEWTGMTAADFQYIVIYMSGGALLCLIDLESAQSLSGQNYRIAWHADGILRLL